MRDEKGERIINHIKFENEEFDDLIKKPYRPVPVKVTLGLGYVGMKVIVHSKDGRQTIAEIVAVAPNPERRNEANVFYLCID